MQARTCQATRHEARLDSLLELRFQMLAQAHSVAA